MPINTDGGIVFRRSTTSPKPTGQSSVTGGQPHTSGAPSSSRGFRITSVVSGTPRRRWRAKCGLGCMVGGHASSCVGAAVCWPPVGEEVGCWFGEQEFDTTFRSEILVPSLRCPYIFVAEEKNVLSFGM